MASPVDVLTVEYAREQDETDKLHHLRDEFVIPNKSDLRRTKLAIPPGDDEGQLPADQEASHDGSEPSIYLCGNSLGLQPRRTRRYIEAYLSTWAGTGVYGHFKPLDAAPTVPWVDIGDQAADAVCKLVGARPSEVAVMQTLTANLHLLLSSFYRPTKERFKIILEGKAFPSDHYAVLSQLEHHGVPAEEGMVLVEPENGETHYFPTERVLETIERHAEQTALILLPGVHYFTGQLWDIPRITAFAHDRHITIGWDLAHAAGNVPLQLHEWNVDFAAWCSYKYLNAGPGSIAGLFVHERHGHVTHRADGTAQDEEATQRHEYVPRLSGWWGSDKTCRFRMENRFVPIPGARGWQLSNPSVFDCTSVLASLSVFAETSMHELRAKSVTLTGYLERLLHEWPMDASLRAQYRILTPTDPQQRGAQLSIRLSEGLLEPVMEALEREGVVVDERRPDVVRVAPAPLYNSYEDVWRFMVAFEKALGIASRVGGRDETNGGTMIDGPAGKSGWGEVT